MEYFVGVLVAFAVAGLAARIGFDRDRSFAATVLIISATYYILFAVIGGSTRAVIIECTVATGFLLVALIWV